MCLGIAPENIYFHMWTKADVATGQAGHLVSMEKSANASYKLTKKPEALHLIEKFNEILTAFIQSHQHP